MIGLIGFILMLGSVGALELGNIGFAQCVGQAVAGIVMLMAQVKILELKEQITYIKRKSKRGC